MNKRWINGSFWKIKNQLNFGRLVEDRETDF